MTITMLLVAVGLHGAPNFIVQVEETFPTVIACEFAVPLATKNITAKLNEKFGNGSYTIVNHSCSLTGDPA